MVLPYRLFLTPASLNLRSANVGFRSFQFFFTAHFSCFRPGLVASNNGLSEQQEIWLLENYFESGVTEPLIIGFKAMKSASLLRETMWSMVSEIHSELDFDYAAYTAENMHRFDTAYDNDKLSFKHHG